MNTAAKLSAYGVALVLVAGGAWTVGTAVGPVGGVSAADAGHGHMTMGAGRPDRTEGLASSSDGYTFVPTTTTLIPGVPQPFSFRITGPDGRPVTGFDVEHEQRLHLIVVRRDTAVYQHLHPTLDADGTWTVPLNLPSAGSYRLLADFVPTGQQPMTLGVDLAVPGDFRPAEHQPSRESVVDGYRVQLSGDPVAGRASTLTLRVSRDGKPVTDLQPYLGAYGHLVALRGGDLAYVHVHPEGAPGDGRTPAGPDITFHAELPSAGTYRLFLDFQHAGTVRTAQFTVAATREQTP
ncbi:hypothetical protein [Nocardia terpenica]|uniref:Heavy metal-binding domain-containing protein n=1 Tax=Nocardia terpenica TaxID=455432 RepID=A0A291RL53_9NOCA|nr:hypothetical protein [Nocardia terpenica]ATL68020.1 hypothetical protein CRH09_19350 [Nocardia terpenica]